MSYAGDCSRWDGQWAVGNVQQGENAQERLTFPACWNLCNLEAWLAKGFVDFIPLISLVGPFLEQASASLSVLVGGGWRQYLAMMEGKEG